MTRALNELFTEYGMNIRINERQTAGLIRMVDDSGDGRIQKPEFLQMVRMMMSGSHN